jgi:two-component system, NarL family, nitrate/nitrite response regulator NarL
MTDLVLGDDHTVFAEALVGLLTRHGFTVGAVASSLPAVVEAVREHKPDVCLLDRHFVDADALDVIDDILGTNGRTRVLMLTADQDVEGLARALRSGARGYVHKSSGFAVLVDAITRIVRDDNLVVEVPGQFPSRPSPELTEARRLAGYLTGRERECLALIVDGLGTQEMAQRLGVSSTTVRTHSQRLLTKLGVHSRLEAASIAVRYALLDGPPVA